MKILVANWKLQNLGMAKSSLSEFIQSGKLIGNSLTVTVIKKVTAEVYIIGDVSRLGILQIKRNEKDMKIGAGIKLIKPLQVNENMIQCNPHFKPMKTFDHEKISPKAEEIESMERKAEVNTVAEDDSYTNFEEIKILSISF